MTKTAKKTPKTETKAPVKVSVKTETKNVKSFEAQLQEVSVLITKLLGIIVPLAKEMSEKLFNRLEGMSGMSEAVTKAGLDERLMFQKYAEEIQATMQNMQMMSGNNAKSMGKYPKIFKECMELINAIDKRYPDLLKFAAEFKAKHIAAEKKMHENLDALGHQGVAVAMNDGSDCKGGDNCDKCGSH